jgi:hypothetical protein
VDGSNALAAKDYKKAEQLSLAALKANDCNPNDRHFAYNTLIKLYYKQRGERADAIEKCVHYCVEDINRLEEFIEFHLEEFTVLPGIPSINRLLIIEEKGGAIEDAIELCGHAIKLGFQDHDTKGGYPARLEKLKRKLNK